MKAKNCVEGKGVEMQKLLALKKNEQRYIKGMCV